MAAPDTPRPPETPKAPADVPGAPPTGPPFPVVGIGASAGGLEAFTELLKSLPAEPGLAILYAAHLEPHHKSRLAEILANVTAMPAREVAEGMAVEVNHVYLLPPNTNMALTDGKLSLSPRSPVPGQHMPIDHLFRSLAGIQKNRAIGVILSGGGTDGTLGFQAIKAEGGITIAQDDKTAGQPGMPRSAILDGNVDYVLPPREIAQRIARLAHHPYAQDFPDADPAAAKITAEILGLVRSANQVDFTHYKKTTINRRLRRRMALLDCHDLEEYYELLRRDKGELTKLYQDLLIRVTQFFREPEAFDALRDQVLPVLIRPDRPRDQPLRIWVAGCSTGEEVYSLAILLLEFLESRPDRPPIKILATDINEQALEKARAGIYIDNIESDISPERLRRFFNRVDSQYQISKAVRELCVFSRHNLVSDAPFSRIDLVSCRNVLIYLDTPLQKRVLPLLHYALNPEGFLFLGTSESLGAFTELFNVVDGRHRIFRRKRATVARLATPLDFGEFSHGEAGLPNVGRGEEGPIWSALDVQREADRIVLARYAPVGVVIDETMAVLQFRGRTAPYLEPAPGLASLDLFRMLREGLLAEVRAGVNQARTQDTTATRTARRATDNVAVRVEVIPFKVPPSGVRFFLVLFQDVSAAPAAAAAEARPPVDAQVAQLQQELGAVREYLQSVIEEHESTNEELKSANEEVLSANEELQSTNEELQTAKEEAQSANEELATVNEELRFRNAELGRVNNDLVNLLSGVGIPIVMVSRDLRIRRFTPPAEKLFNLIPTDVGRPISDIKPNLDVPDLARLIAGVIDSLIPQEGEVKDTEGHTYSLRVRPYVTLDKTIDGASLVLIELDSLRSKGEGPEKTDEGRGARGEGRGMEDAR